MASTGRYVNHFHIRSRQVFFPMAKQQRRRQKATRCLSTTSTADCLQVKWLGTDGKNYEVISSFAAGFLAASSELVFFS